MSFIQRELDLIHNQLNKQPPRDTYDRLYAAQQALAWAADPSHCRSPYNHVMDIREPSGDCLADPKD